MKKFNLMGCALATILAGTSVYNATAQTIKSFETNWYKDYIGERVTVLTPTSLAKSYNHTITNDGTGATGEWGGAIPGAGILNAEVVPTAPLDACAALTNASAINGKIAILNRGTCEFGSKALAAQQAGAIAVIIVNNVVGGPVGMGAGATGTSVNIPVLMVSQAEGAAIIAAAQSGTVTMSLTKWGNNLTHDLGLVDRGGAIGHSYATPFHQMGNANTVDAFKNVNGALVANFGTSTETAVKLKAKTTWNPDGGAPEVIKENEVTMSGSFPVLDSIHAPFVNETYGIKSSTTKGRYDIEYTVEAADADEFPNDNKATYSYYVSNDVFSRGRYDFAKMEPVMGGYYAFQTPSDFMYGPTYYATTKDYQIKSVQVSISKAAADGNDLTTVAPLNVLIFKWADANTDGVVQSGEVTRVGTASREFVAGDTSGHIFTLPVTDPVDDKKMVYTEANTWYWVTAVVPSGIFLGVDGETNYHIRSYNRFRANGVKESYAPIFNSDYTTFTSSAINEPSMFPFEATDNIDSVRFAQQKKGLVPSIPMLTSIFPVSVKETSAGSSFDISMYPNPASDVLNVSLKLENEAKKVYYTIVDATGKSISTVSHNNVKNDTYKIATSALAAGNYYLIINANGKATTRSFSVVK